MRERNYLSIVGTIANVIIQPKLPPRDKLSKAASGNIAQSFVLLFIDGITETPGWRERHCGISLKAWT